MLESRQEYMRSVLLALFVTVLWSSSWVIIKFGLQDIPPLIFSGLRYSIASGILLVIILGRYEFRQAIKGRTRDWWLELGIYGFISITVTQGAQFVGLSLMDAIAVSLLLNMTPLMVLVLGSIILREVPTKSQIGWIMVGLAGVLIYFQPLEAISAQALGLAVVSIGVIAWACSSILGRNINKRRKDPPIIITGISMTIGGVVLLASGIVFERGANLTPLAIIYVLWLSIVNTAFAFTLWHWTMRTLRAIDSTIINGTMLPQIVILSMVFLEEIPTILDWLGLLLIGVSAVAVQLIQVRRKERDESIGEPVPGMNPSTAA